jgi:hypothetical protein
LANNFLRAWEFNNLHGYATFGYPSVQLFIHRHT